MSGMDTWRSETSGECLLLSIEQRVLVLHLLCKTTGLKNFDDFFTQSEVKPNPIMTAVQAISHALRLLHVIALSFDWFIVLPECVFCDWLE